MAAPGIIVGDVLATQLIGQVFGQTTVTTFHWVVDAIVGVPTLTDVLNALNTNMVPDFLDICSEDWSAQILRGRRVSPNPTRSYDVVLGGLDGVVASPSLPPSVAGVIARYTNAPGPRGRGRIYVPGVPASYHDDGLLTNLGLNSYAAFTPHLDLQKVLAGVATLDPVLFRRPNTITRIEGTKINVALRSQRRREIGVGI